MIKKYFTNSLATGLSDMMRVGAEVVFYKDHLAEIAKKDVYIQQLRGALGYSVSGNISEKPEILNGLADALHRQLAEKDKEIAELKKDLALNASMLARQCDLAREAETACAEKSKLIAFLQEDNARLYFEIKSLTNIKDKEIERLKSALRTITFSTSQVAAKIAEEALKEQP